MKVLLFADLSGFQQALRDGLAAHGVDVTLASSGDGFKAIAGADFRLGTDPSWGAARRALHRLSILRLFPGHDVVQFVNPMALAGNAVLNELLLRYVRATNDRLFTAVCSLDYRVHAAYLSGELRYGPYAGARSDQGPFRVNDAEMAATRRSYDQMIGKVDGIIPISADYSVPYRDHPKMRGMIPAPIRTDSLEYRPNLVSSKIVFMHGVQRGREGFKGTATIKAALEWLAAEYPDDVDVVYPSNLPFDEYKAVLYRSNVIIDQCNSLAPGLNALQAMAMGRVALSGSSQEHLDSLGLDSTPLIPITNDLDTIKAALRDIVLRRDDIPAMGERSRAFVERHHAHVMIAQRYIDRWNGV